MEVNQIYNENCLDTLARMPDNFLDCCITSPPYWSLRDYGHPDQMGLEDTPDEYAAKMADVFDEVRRCLKPDGTLWLNLGDSYLSAKCDYMPPQTIAGEGVRDYVTKDSGIGYPPNRRSIKGLKQKDLVGIPWLVAFELRRRGWWLRQDIIWAKPNPMPESVKDRCTKSHEYIFLLSKSQQYHFDYKAIQEKSIHYGLDPRSGQDRIAYTDGKRDGTAGNGQEAFVTINEMKNKRDVWEEESPNKGRDRTVGNRNGLGQSTLDHKNLKYDGQEPNSFHVARAEGESDEIYEMRNKRDVWNITTKSFKDAHFATFPESLVNPMMLAGCPEGGLVYDPFCGAATVPLVAHKLGRNWIGSELNPDYVKIANARLEPYLAQSSLF